MSSGATSRIASTGPRRLPDNMLSFATNGDLLDFGTSNAPDGYAVFARLVGGLAAVDEIAGLVTGFVNGIGNDVPSTEIVLIESATIED